MTRRNSAVTEHQHVMDYLEHVVGCHRNPSLVTACTISSDDAETQQRHKVFIADSNTSATPKTLFVISTDESQLPYLAIFSCINPQHRAVPRYLHSFVRLPLREGHEAVNHRGGLPNARDVIATRLPPSLEYHVNTSSARMRRLSPAHDTHPYLHLQLGVESGYIKSPSLISERNDLACRAQCTATTRLASRSGLVWCRGASPG